MVSKNALNPFAWSKCPFRKHLEPGESFVCDASALLLYHGDAHAGDQPFAELVRKITDDRVRLGPGTLYAILSTFETESVIAKFSQEGRRITYKITEKGEKLYQDELQRLRKCLWDSQRDLSTENEQSAFASEGQGSRRDLATV